MKNIESIRERGWEGLRMFTWVPKWEKEKEAYIIFEEIMAKTFTNWMKDANLGIQDSHKTQAW